MGLDQMLVDFAKKTSNGFFPNIPRINVVDGSK